MLNGKISDLAKQYSNQKIKYMIMVWSTLLIFIGIGIGLYLIDVSDILFSIALFVMIVVMFIVLFYSKAKVDYYDLMQRYQLLLDHSENPIQVTCLFDLGWIQSLLKGGYQLFFDSDLFSIYFTINKSLVKKTFIKTNLIEIIVIIKDDQLDFYDDIIENQLKKLWISYEKEYTLNKQVIMQFKKYERYSPDLKESLNRIIAYKEKDNFLININCGYFLNNNSVYFLHSNYYHPNVYYKYGVDKIKEIVGMTKKK